jgi:hypothetical protein
MNVDIMNASEPRKRRRLALAPAPSNPRLHSPVLNVECAEDEDVQWQWTQTSEGRFVSGYAIVSRLDKRPR